MGGIKVLIKDFKANIQKNFIKATVIGSALSLVAGCSLRNDATEVNSQTGKASSKQNANADNGSLKQPKPKTNIVYIVIDDSGFSDLGSYGSEIKTPNLDKLAENGLRYSNFHVTPLCSPTRASLLTGRNNHSVGMGTVTNFDFGPSYPNRRGSITPAAATVAEVLSENDYNTYALGKWHLAPTSEVTPAGPYNNRPLEKGFQRYYGFLEGASDQYQPELTEDNHPVPVPKEDDYHFSEDIVEKAQQYVLDNIAFTPDKPFHMYMSFGAPHQPHQVSQKYIDMYKGVYDKGWDKIRKERFEKQKELGIIPADTKLAPLNSGIKEWESLSEEEKRAFVRYQETYAGFLTHTDEQIGEFIKLLEDKGELDNTLIMFISDNGASAAGGEVGALNHTLAYNAIPEELDDVIENIDNMGSSKVGIDYPAGWAQVSNTPFKFYKNSTYAGGTHTPLIVHWPEGIKNKGEIRDQYIHVVDITPTIYDVLGIDVPKTIKGVKQMEIHGESFADTFTNANAESKRTTQYFETSGHRAIYHDGWRAVAHHKKGEPFEKDQWELYHVEKDFSESTNLADEDPTKLKQMIELWEKEAKKYDVYPLTDMFIDAFPNVPTDSLRARDIFTFYPGQSHLSDSAAPPIINRSYSIDIPITHNTNNDGVLVASGDISSGYTLYIKDNRLVYEYNAGFTRYKIVSDSKLSAGDLNVRFEFTKTAENAGIGTLYVNDEKIGEGTLEKTLPYKISFEGLDIGKDIMYPVSDDYGDREDFPYTGSIEKVEFIMSEPVSPVVK
jgi:arylsulfatase A-like enzyme